MNEIARARLLRSSGQTEAAWAIVAAHLARNPEDADALDLAADLQVDRGDDPEAIALASRALAVHPDHEGALTTFAMACARQRRGAEARWAVERLRAAYPGHWTSHVNGAAAHLLMGYVPGETLSMAEEGVRLAPGQPQAHVVLGDVASHFRQRTRAGAAYREALRLDPANLLARHNLGVMGGRGARDGRRADIFATILAEKPGWKLVERNFIAAMAQPLTRLYYLELAMIILAIVALGPLRIEGARDPDLLIVASIAAWVAAAAPLVASILLVVLFLRDADGNGPRLLGAAGRLDRSLVVFAAGEAFIALALVATAALPGSLALVPLGLAVAGLVVLRVVALIRWLNRIAAR